MERTVETVDSALNQSFPSPDIDARGVDRSQIRNQLKLTPSERLRALEVFLASVQASRHGRARRPHHEFLSKAPEFTTLGGEPSFIDLFSDDKATHNESRDRLD
jgi:hypothetical protein